MRILIVGAMMTLGIMLPTWAEAETTCTCFCGSPQDGAVRLDGTYTANDCIQECEEDGKEPVGCYTREDHYPQHSERCWTQEQCTSENAGNVWEDKVSNCDDGRGEKMGYCYAAPRSLSTIISIGDDNTFSGLPDYVDTLYRYLVPVMGVVAIIMVMVAGLQYILSRGNPSAVKQAKTRMASAVVGLLLLLSAYTLARLLDPRLVNLEQLRIPKVKEVVMLSSGNMCKTISAAGLEIDDVKRESFVDKTCGKKGKVTDVSELLSNVDIGSWTEGDTCMYSVCGAGEACVAESDGSASCVACEDASSSGLRPSESVCAQMQSLSDSTTADQDYCIYSSASGTGTSFDNAGCDYSAQCVSVPIECAALQDVGQGEDGCAKYGDQDADFGDLLVLCDSTLENYSEIDKGAIYSQICSSDPCGLAKRSGGSRCVFSSTNDTYTCTKQ